MRQRLTIILTIVVILGLLVLLNTITYVKEKKLDDSEFAPNRSTYHGGPTGTRALYDFLSETGHKVMRWRDSTEKLLDSSGNQVKTFIVIGRTQLPFTDNEAKSLREWIQDGGQLVMIDRDPDRALLPQSGDWSLYSHVLDTPPFELDPTDIKQVTAGVVELKPVQPTLLTRDVQEVMPSRFSARASAVPLKPEPETENSSLPSDDVSVDQNSSHSTAPVIHISDRNGAFLVDYEYGLGRVTFVGDPYVVANNGIHLKDNLQLATNIVASNDGLIAFDEYHQGKGIVQNEFANYFEGTPVLAIAAQIVILVVLILWASSRRFARPLPLVQIDRRSGLEFVASMSELQERSRAFDLAVENIYSRTRRVLARYAGVDYNSSRSEVATRVAMRSTIDAHSLETLMKRCEETINGAPTSARQALDLVRRLRAVERTLGLRMRSRDVRQATEHV